MSGLLTFVLPADLRAAKRRVDATVRLVNGSVGRTPTLDATTRHDWLVFEEAWRAFEARDDGESTASQYDEVDVFVRKLRAWQSLLSSQCFGVPSPAPKRELPLLPTWVTPSLVTAEKERVGRRVAALAARASSASLASSPFASAWAYFLKGWTAFVREADAWTHAAAQYDGVQAYEDVMPEWEEALELARRAAGAGLAPATPASHLPNSPGAPFENTLRQVIPARPAPTRSGFALGAAAVIVVGLAIAHGAGRR